VFKNGWDVTLSAIEELPEGIIFENRGNIKMHALKKLPASTLFENDGYIWLPSLDSKSVEYRNKAFIVRNIDNFTMLVRNTKQIEGYAIHSALYLKGGALDELEGCYIAEKDGFTAHGATVREAIEDVELKWLQNNSDVSEIAEAVKERGRTSASEYRLLTGACRLGVEKFLAEHNIEADELPLDEVLELTEGEYGHDRLVEVIEAA